MPPLSKPRLRHLTERSMALAAARNGERNAALTETDAAEADATEAVAAPGCAREGGPPTTGNERLRPAGPAPGAAWSQPSSRISSRTDNARTATSPIRPQTFCHHLLRISAIRPERLAMRMMSAASTGATNTVNACAVTIS